MVESLRVIIAMHLCPALTYSDPHVYSSIELCPIQTHMYTVV